MAFEGLYWTTYPLTSSPVYRLSEEGGEVKLTGTGIGFAASWRESRQLGTSYNSFLYLQAFDQDGQPLANPVQLRRHAPLAHRPRVSYLGGVFLVTWVEQDGWADLEPGRIMSAQVTEAGRMLSGPEEVLTVTPAPRDLFQLRVDDAILVGYVEPGELSDELHFLRFACVP